MEATVSLARRVERAEIDFCAVAGGVGVAGGGRSVEAAGGRGLYCAPGSPLNKVLGLGVGCPVSDADLDAIEAFYAQHECPVQIELCPLAAADVPARLSARGYVLRFFENELARSLDRFVAGVEADEATVPRVDVVTSASREEWLDAVSEGFVAAEGSPPSTLDAAATEAVRSLMSRFDHPLITRYLAWIDEQPAGGGASYVTDGTLGIFGTATAPRFRRRGVQRAVAARALRDGAGRADLAITTTEPGSTSQRVFERLGFHVIYTRAILIKALV
jgi:hypothetical protein